MSDEPFTLSRVEQTALLRARKLSTRRVRDDLAEVASHVTHNHHRPEDLRELAFLALILARRLDLSPRRPVAAQRQSPSIKEAGRDV